MIVSVFGSNFSARPVRATIFPRWHKTVEVWPILYACGEANMGPWLAAHGLAAAEDAFLARLHGETAVFVRDLLVRGFVYFRYGGPDDDGCLR